MSHLANNAKPASFLARHRLLAPTASVYVSPLSLGGMSIGSAWGPMMGECTKDHAFAYLDAFYSLGGNFIDTANMYQAGQSEKWIGEWMQKHNRRAEMVVATKYTLPNRVGQEGMQKSNFGGTGTKNMWNAIEESLANLMTEYVDVYYVHGWDMATGVEELMQSLNVLVQQRKVLYLGISDAPAWVVVKANAYARQHGLRPFSIYQGRYSVLLRDMERDIIPMCRDEGMAIHPFGVLGQGYLRLPNAPPKEGGRQTSFMNTGREDQVAVVVDKVAKRHGVPITSIALAYVMQKAPHMFPMVGGTSIEKLKLNVEALGIELNSEDISELDKAYDFDIGFPNNFLNRGNYMPLGPQDMTFLAGMGHFDYVKPTKAIRPVKEAP